MRRTLLVFALIISNAGGILHAQRSVDPSQRYFRLICLVHLTGSGQAGDPVVPEYVVQGTAVAQSALDQAAKNAAANANQSGPPASVRPAPRAATSATGSQGQPPPPLPMSSRPGILGWAMQPSDDGTMAIIQLVAADHHAFDSILADTRPEIRVFEIGKSNPAAIQAEMQKYKADFDLNKFQVRVQ